MDNTSQDKLVRARRLIALGATYKQIMASEKLAARSIRRLRDLTAIRPSMQPSKVHKCHECGGRHSGEICLVCQIRRQSKRGVA